ncbi:MAG: pyridoxamine 5'-phosphate oxidase family protein [Pseudomonadota bacterium]
MLAKMLELIRGQRLSVLATAGADGAPHCSLMSYAWHEGRRVIWLVTSAGTRKFANLGVNPAVSLLIDTRDAPAAGGPVAALTIAGAARALPPGPERAEALAALLARHPDLMAIATQADAQVLEVTPAQLQLLEGPGQAHHARLEPAPA